MNKRFILGISSIACLVTLSLAQSIKPAKPTHLMYTPTPNVNPAYHLIIGLHEISFALPAKLQLQASILDNIGRINFGAKYGLADNVAVGAGMAYSLAHIGDGAHVIPREANPRLGIFLTVGLAGDNKNSFQLNLTPHTQIGDFFSIGGDLGLLASPHPIWSIMWEVGTSYVFDGSFWMNTNVGIRITPPKAKFLFIDFGIDLNEFEVTDKTNPKPTVSPYIDFTFGMNTK